MDCTTFKQSEIDALYGELDAAASAAMDEHAATCASCAARIEQLRSTRGLVLSVALEAVPDDFESRIMAAVDAGLATKRAAPGAGPVKGASGAKILRLMARPSFAVAATFVLIIGAGAMLMTSAARKSAPMTASESAPAASALTPMAPVEANDKPGSVVAAAAPPVATATAPATASGYGAYAMNEPAAAALESTPPEARSHSGRPGPSKAAKPQAQAGEDKAFTAAKALFDAGRYSEALPKFEALKVSNPEAALYAARCVARTQGCTAAAPRFDQAAQANAGTEVGSRATIEGAKCYRASGNVTAARSRLQTARDEGFLATEAAHELDALERSGGGSATGGHAAPKAPMPAAAPAPNTK